MTCTCYPWGPLKADPLCPVHGDPRDTSMRHNAPERATEAQERPQSTTPVTDSGKPESATPAGSTVADILDNIVLMLGYLDNTNPEHIEYHEFVRLLAETQLQVESLRSST